jgi:hypothetical protein
VASSGVAHEEVVRASCNHGSKRRAAVRVGYHDGSAGIVDRNVDDVGDYRVWVGEATIDEGECEGVNETWYEVLISRVTP